MKYKYFYIEFEIASCTRFISLKVIFEELKKVNNDWMKAIYCESENRELNYADPIDDFPWQSYLDNQAKHWFQDTFNYQTE